jgi:hypothetical protein
MTRERGSEPGVFSVCDSTNGFTSPITSDFEQFGESLQHFFQMCLF